MDPVNLKLTDSTLADVEALCAAHGAMFRIGHEDGRMYIVVDRKGAELMASLSDQPVAALAQLDQRLAAVDEEA